LLTEFHCGNSRELIVFPQRRKVNRTFNRKKSYTNTLANIKKMKPTFIIFFFIFIVLAGYQKLLGQNKTTLTGKVIHYNDKQSLPGVIVQTYFGGKHLNETSTNFESGSFTLSTEKTFDEIVFSYLFFYPLIIENIKKIDRGELNLGQIKLIEAPISFTHFASKKAERIENKKDKLKLLKLKKGVIISDGKVKYRMKLKKKKGKYAFYIDYKDFKNK